MKNLKICLGVFSILTFLLFASSQDGQPQTFAMEGESYVKEMNAEVTTEEIVRYVRQYAGHKLEKDQMIEWKPNVFIKESNLFGVKYKGDTYYYSLIPHMSFDPVSRGDVQMKNIKIIYKQTDGSFPIVIYKINKN